MTHAGRREHIFRSKLLLLLLLLFFGSEDSFYISAIQPQMSNINNTNYISGRLWLEKKKKKKKKKKDQHREIEN